MDSQDNSKARHQLPSAGTWEELTGPLQEHMLPDLPARTLAMLRQTCHLLRDLVDLGTG